MGLNIFSLELEVEGPNEILVVSLELKISNILHKKIQLRAEGQKVALCNIDSEQG